MELQWINEEPLYEYYAKKHGKKLVELTQEEVKKFSL